MKALNIFTIAALTATMFACGSASTENQETTETAEETPIKAMTVSHSIDPDNSTIHWKGEMLGMYAHEGTIEIRESYISMENGTLAGGGFIVDMSTITPTDSGYMDEDGKRKSDLVGHLSSPDFFDIANHPKAAFDITEVNGEEIKGLLTLRGKRHEEVVKDVKIHGEGDVYHLSGTLTFDRKKYDVAFDHPVKEMVLSDDITLNLDFKTLNQVQ